MASSGSWVAFVCSRARLWCRALCSEAYRGDRAAPRITYFLTVPFALLAIFVLSRLAEPGLRRVEESPPLRSQIRTTYTTIVERGQLRPIISAMVLCALLLQALVEFGPLWMVALAAPAFLFGPQWAGLMSAMGLGGVLGGRLSLERQARQQGAAGWRHGGVQPGPDDQSSFARRWPSWRKWSSLSLRSPPEPLSPGSSTTPCRQTSGPASLRESERSRWPVAFVPFALGFGLLSAMSVFSPGVDDCRHLGRRRRLAASPRTKPTKPDHNGRGRRGASQRNPPRPRPRGTVGPWSPADSQ